MIGLCRKEDFNSTDFPEDATTSYYIIGNTGEAFLAGEKFADMLLRIGEYGSTGGLL